MTTLDAALRYARAGHPVLPLIPGRKLPLSDLVPHGLKDATTDPETLQGWWAKHPDAGVAIRCDGLVVLDVDPGGEESLASLEAEHEPLPPTREQRTPRGGRHLIYRLPKGVEVGNSTRGLGRPGGLDVRAGDRGYVAVAPSRSGGAAYRWSNRLPIEDAPAWLVETLRRPSRDESPVPPVRLDGEHSAYGRAALDAEVAEVEAAPVGQRNTRLNEAAFALGQLEAGGELARGDAEAALVAAATRAGLPEAEARRTARSGLETGQASPRNAPRSSSEGRPIVLAHPAATKETASVALANVLRSVREYLDIRPGEESFLYAALVVAVSKALTDEEPLWAMLVGAPSSGKSEAIRLLDGLADLRVDELTRAGLLSWGTGGKRAKRSGILTRIPPYSLLTVSDFSTVVTASDREGRARMFGMLRVVYDGHVYRGIGGEPSGDGEELQWSGHLTLVAAATPAIDSATAFEGALGERWLTLRLPESDAARATARARYVVSRRDLGAHRREAQEHVRSLVHVARGRIPEQLPTPMIERLVNLATFVAHARTGVQHEGTGRYRVILGVPTPEEPTRLVGQLARFARCAVALGVDHSEALDLTTRVALDSVPLARMRVLRAVVEGGDHGTTVSDAHRALIRGNRWAAMWELDALEAIGLITVEGPSRDEDPKATRLYRLTDMYREVCETAYSPLPFPPNKEEKQNTHRAPSDAFAHPPRTATTTNEHTEDTTREAKAPSPPSLAAAGVANAAHSGASPLGRLGAGGEDAARAREESPEPDLDALADEVRL